MTRGWGAKQRGKEAHDLGRAVCVAVALTLGSSGCTTVAMFGTGIPEPERISPGFSDEDPQFPSLATVPERPAHTPTRQSERQRILRELQEDLGGAEFAPAPKRPNPDSAPSPGANRKGAASDAAPLDSSPTARFGAARRAVSHAPDEGSRPDDGSLGRQNAEAEGAATGGGDGSPEFPRIQPSEQGEPIHVPAAVGGEEEGARIGAAVAPAVRASDSVSVVAAGLAPSAAVRPGTLEDARNSANALGERIATIYFGHGSAELESHDLAVLREAARLHAVRGGRLTIVGHASSRVGDPMDPVSHRIANLDISLRRAEAVAETLGAAGVRSDVMRVEGRGDGEPVYHEFISTGEAGNRRVEIYLKD